MICPYGHEILQYDRTPECDECDDSAYEKCQGVCGTFLTLKGIDTTVSPEDEKKLFSLIRELKEQVYEKEENFLLLLKETLDEFLNLCSKRGTDKVEKLMGVSHFHGQAIIDWSKRTRAYLS